MKVKKASTADKHFGTIKALFARIGRKSLAIINKEKRFKFNVPHRMKKNESWKLVAIVRRLFGHRKFSAPYRWALCWKRVLGLNGKSTEINRKFDSIRTSFYLKESGREW